jgi:hypothetical protein
VPGQISRQHDVALFLEPARRLGAPAGRMPKGTRVVPPMKPA